MIPEEVKQAFGKVDPAKGIMEFRAKRMEWESLFKYYNENNEIKIYTSCRPCFPKVYYFIKMVLAKQVQ